MKVVAVLVGLVVGAEGLSIAAVVVVEDPPLEPEGRVAVEAGVLVPEAKVQTLTWAVGTSIVVVTPV